MGRKSRLNIVLSILFTFEHLYAVFPSTKCIATDTLEPDVMDYHRTWASYVSIVNAVDAPNYFVCGFRFVLSGDSTPIWIELKIKHVKALEDFDSLFIKNTTKRGKSKKLGIFQRPEATICDENMVVFESNSGNAYVNGALMNLRNQFHWTAKQGEDIATRNQAMLLKDVGARAHFGVMRATDSEAGAIYALQESVINRIINELYAIINAIPSTAEGAPIQITSIEFHGCTSRDMCALCFTNMNIIQYLCNDSRTYDPNYFSFLKHLKYRLTTEKSPRTEISYATSDYSTKMFISSTIAGFNNLNFQNPTPRDEASLEDGFLYQFRILDDGSVETRGQDREGRPNKKNRKE